MKVMKLSCEIRSFRWPEAFDFCWLQPSIGPRIHVQVQIFSRSSAFIITRRTIDAPPKWTVATRCQKMLEEDAIRMKIMGLMSVPFFGCGLPTLKIAGHFRMYIGYNGWSPTCLAWPPRCLDLDEDCQNPPLHQFVEEPHPRLHTHGHFADWQPSAAWRQPGSMCYNGTFDLPSNGRKFQFVSNIVTNKEKHLI